VARGGGFRSLVASSIGLGLCLGGATAASAGAWVQPKGKAQVIVKYEDMRADRAFDADGSRVRLPVERKDRSVGVFAEYGMTDRLTLQFKGDWQDGQDAFVDYQGRGPLEIGVTWQAWRDDKGAISLYGGYASAGEGRNADYAAPGVGQHDFEIRGSAGRSFGSDNPTGRLQRLVGRTFVELQVARRFRDGLSDETRADFTYGRHLGQDWMILSQFYGGQTDHGGAKWLNAETSVVRQFGPWSLQAGWRHAVAGHEIPQAQGPVLAVWRRF